MNVQAPTNPTLIPLGAMLFGLALSPAAHAADSSSADATLGTVLVQDSRETQGTYQPTTTRVGKLPQLAKDIPQSLTVVTSQLMEDTNAHTLKEALRHVSGLTFNAGEGGRIGDNFNLRGFYTFGDMYLDGIRDVAQINRETFNTEQVEVLRGSAAMLFGRGQAGGVINQVSKAAKLDDDNKISTTIGTQDYKRITADLNKMLSEDSAIRVNAMKTDAGSTRDHVTSKREGAAIDYRWGIDTRDEFALSYYYLKVNNVPDYGVPFFKNRPLDVPGSRFYGTSSDFENNQVNMATASWQHKFSDDTVLRSILRGAEYSRDLWATQPQLRNTGCAAGTVTSWTDASCINRSVKARGGNERTLTSQTDLTTKFTTGTLKHEALIGVELLKEDANRWSYTGASNFTTTVGNPDADPTMPAAFNKRAQINPASYSGLTKAIYGQDIIEFIPGWKALFGIRRDQLDVSYRNTTTSTKTTTQGDFGYGENSYRSGLSWQPSDSQHYYLAYSNSFSPTADLYQYTSTQVVLPPERSKTYELGAKWELLNGKLSLRSALYRAEKTWERNTDTESASASPNSTVLSQKRHTDGLELEAAGRITHRWDVFAGVNFMKARIDDPTATQNAALADMRPRNAPPYTFNLWSTYNLGGGWRIGGGVEAKGDRLAYGLGSGVPNPNIAPAYQRWDAMVSYTQPAYTLKLNVLNLFDKRYYESVYDNGGHAVPGTQRAVQMTAEYKF